jgi:16S rRNA (cytosine1402-N4)-methyltransferase
MLIQELKILPKNLLYHKPVLLQSACHYLEIQPKGLYVDATIGGGGHAREIINRGGLVLGLDQDPEAIAESSKVEGLILENTNFTHLSEAVAKHNWKPVSGILFDLGVSSHQFDTPVRGFSFQNEGPLDMRMGASAVTAADIINRWPASQLTGLFKEYGELPVAKSLSEKIVSARPFHSTTELAQIAGKWSRQVFQALRITVNDELGAIKTALPQALSELKSGGRLVVITFHSLEDRIVKNLFQEWESQGLARILTKTPVTASPEELEENPRSKSAKLRSIEKI